MRERGDRPRLETSTRVVGTPLECLAVIEVFEPGLALRLRSAAIRGEVPSGKEPRPRSGLRSLPEVLGVGGCRSFRDASGGVPTVERVGHTRNSGDFAAYRVVRYGR